METEINETIFNNWCKDLAKKLLNKNMISEEGFTDTISAFIKSDLDVFLSSITSELDKEISILKKRASLLFGTDTKEYFETGYRLGVLNDRKKKINIYQTKYRKETGIKKLKDFLKEKGHDELIDQFYERANKIIQEN
jgi:SOS response regulatory protein OraA/RecX